MLSRILADATPAPMIPPLPMAPWVDPAEFGWRRKGDHFERHLTCDACEGVGRIYCDDCQWYPCDGDCGGYGFYTLAMYPAQNGYLVIQRQGRGDEADSEVRFGYCATLADAAKAVFVEDEQ